ncbi:hypothetical protein [Nonomuraea guangzhouensis]|uniref:Transposase n=1 Tax=Nonomuraea guangzhouensis TaxID=1291555 RepID=A0ABW4GWJ9_9ACTN|nr:hypothetical protein [Nonomuraea guangzhouensis]
MAVQRVTLTVGDTAYDVGTVEALGTDDERWAELERFLRAVADTLKDGYTLRRKAPATGEPAEIADLPVEVRRLVHAVDRLRADWAEADEDHRHNLWTNVHAANERVWNRVKPS